MSTDFFTRFALPSLLRQDPRYFRQGKGRAGPRIGYAVTRVLVTRGDNGRRQFNFSQVVGSMFSAALTNAYYPDEDRTAGRTLARARQALGGERWFECAPRILAADPPQDISPQERSTRGAGESHARSRSFAHREFGSGSPR